MTKIVIKFIDIKQRCCHVSFDSEQTRAIFRRWLDENYLDFSNKINGNILTIYENDGIIYTHSITAISTKDYKIIQKLAKMMEGN